MRTDISVSESMRRCHRCRRQTQPRIFGRNIGFARRLCPKYA
jgi:hypothetical protein